MVREKVKAKKARLNPDQGFSLEEDNKSDQELMEEQMLYDEQSQQSKDNTSEDTESQNIESQNMMASLENMLEAEDISDASARLEEYSQRYERDDEMAQCVPEFVYTPVETEPNEPKVTKHKPRMKFTAKRDRTPEKAQKQKIKPSKNSVTPQSPPAGSESEDEFPKAKKEGTWIQCSKIDCLKWRKLPNDSEPASMPERWVCAMNQDPSRTECTASQETCDSQLDFDVVYTPFVAGSLVWAKVPGYPWWPGMVEDDPDYNCCYETDESNVNPISYHVSFIFDKDVSRSWVSYLAIRNFDLTENPNETGSKQKKYAKPLAKALIQARSAVDLSLTERIKKYSFSVLYKGQIGSESDKKPRKTKKRKQPKSSPEQDNPKKTKVIKPKEKLKRSSLTDSEKSSESCSQVVKKKVKKTKRVLVSSDEEGCKEMATNAPTINSDSSMSCVKNSDGKEDSATKTEEIHLSLEEEKSKNAITKEEEMLPQNSLVHKDSVGDDEKSEKVKIRSAKKNRPATTKNKAPKKKRKSTTSEEEEETTPTPPSKNADNLKIKKKKSEDKPTKKSESRKSKKKSKFVNPVQAKSASVLNESNTSDECAKDLGERLLEKLAKDTSTESSISGFDTSFDSSVDNLTKVSSEEISHTEKPNASSDESTHQSPVKETVERKDSKKSDENKKPKPKKRKPAKVINDNSTTKDSTQISVVKPKKFELTFGTKSTSTNEKKVKKVKKTSIPKISGRENGKGNLKEFAPPSQIVLEGISVKPSKTTKPSNDEHNSKKTSKGKKVTFGKFKAPVKTKVTPAAKVKASKEEKSTAKTLEEVLNIPSSDDPRNNPENYVNIDSLEKDISSLYQELSENAAASTGVNEDDDDVTEASDCVTMEFLHEEISGNTGNSEKIPARRLTDSPEF